MTLPLADLLAFPRPEYAKQTEMILVDLLWRSKGSAIGASGVLAKLGAGTAPRQRLVLRRLGGNSDAKVTETLPWVEDMSGQGLFADDRTRRLCTAAIMGSITAPSSRRDKSLTCAPVHPSLTPLQTLHGAVNKDQPPDLARAVETMVHLGGGTRGRGAQLFADAFGVPGADLSEAFFQAAGREAWSRLQVPLAEPVAWTDRLGVEPLQEDPGEARSRGVLSETAAGWFWTSWSTLLTSDSGWRGALPTRRFVDWAVCILRTGLALTYLWEAEFFVKLRRFLSSDLATCEGPWEAVREMFARPRLLSIGGQGLPYDERSVQAHIASLLGEGYHARARIAEWNGVAAYALDLGGGARANLEAASTFTRGPLRDPRAAPKTTREFVRYLLQARVSDSAAWDEGDLYHLTRSDGRGAWVEPGPEWLVLVASLAARRPGGTCTLGHVRRELARMGLGVDRATLVGLLEGAGLTQDSPDADEAVIVKAGF